MRTRALSYLFVAILALPAFGEECVSKSEPYQGKKVTVETCVARVDDVVRTEWDGYVMVYYIVQYKSQRLVVSDPLAESKFAVGEEISFSVGRVEGPADSPDGRRMFYAIIIPAKKTP